MVLLRALRLFSSLALAAIMLFAIVAPLASVLQASGVDGRVYVVTPRAFTYWACVIVTLIAGIDDDVLRTLSPTSP
jgi:hypothetical protein